MEKKTIMLVCSAGMSTSLLVTKMQKAAEAKGMEADIFAVSASDADNQLESKNVDVLLLCKYALCKINLLKAST